MCAVQRESSRHTALVSPGLVESNSSTLPNWGTPSVWAAKGEFRVPASVSAKLLFTSHSRMPAPAVSVSANRTGSLPERPVDSTGTSPDTLPRTVTVHQLDREPAKSCDLDSLVITLP